MKSIFLFTSLLLAGAAVAMAAEEAIDSRYKPIAPDPAMGDWQGASGYVAQVMPLGEGKYRANVFRAFDVPDDKPLGVLNGSRAGADITFEGDGWTGALSGSHFRASKAGERFELQHVTRTPPALGAKPPVGAVVLFDGKNLDSWAKKSGKEWLKEDGPAKWKLVDGAAVEVVPAADCLISHQKFGDCHVHVEFRTLGTPTNSGVYLQTRYEANINETYGALEGTPNGGFDNCTPKGTGPHVRASRPPLEWQTLEIDFRAPRFDATGKKIASARATTWLNGVRLYNEQELSPPTGAAGRLGEAPTGPIMLQEHGMPVQFRNIWAVEK